MRNYEDLSIFMRESIEKSARKDASAIENEILQKETMMLERAKVEAFKEIEEEFSIKRQALVIGKAQKNAMVKKESDQALIRKRNELFEGLYKELEDNLLSFVKSDSYKVKITAIIEESILKYQKENIIFIIKRDDFVAKALLEAIVDVTFEESDELLYGGLFVRIKTNNQKYDYSIDTALSEAKKWFVKRINFQIDA